MAIDPSETGTYRRLFEIRYNQLSELVEGMDDAGLHWKPFESDPSGGTSGSVGWLAAHSISATILLIRRAEWQMGQREWESVQGDEGDHVWTEADTAQGLSERIARSRVEVEAFLDNLDEAKLGEAREHPERDLSMSTRMDIVHAIEHLSQHLGHASLTRQLWEIERSAS